MNRIANSTRPLCFDLHCDVEFFLFSRQRKSFEFKGYGVAIRCGDDKTVLRSYAKEEKKIIFFSFNTRAKVREYASLQDNYYTL